MNPVPPFTHRWRSQLTLSVVLLFLFSATGRSATQVAFTSSNLPIVIIDTGGKAIPDLKRISADMKVIYNGRGKRNNVTDAPNNYNGKIDIELRGSSSLSYPKKGYRIETVDSSGDNLNVMLLGMPKENDWILYGPYNDQSCIRNNLAYGLSRDMGRYAPRAVFCEVVLNGDYRGLYVMLEKIKQDKNRVNVTEMKPSDISGDAVTGGYVIKYDKIEGENIAGWWSNQGLYYQYHEPKEDDIVPEQKVYIRDFINDFESALLIHDPTDSTIGFPRYIDTYSYVDHFILSEFCKNIDAYRISSYMFKDRDSKGGKMHAGPIWDFDRTFGMTWYPEDAYRYDQWEIDHDEYRPDDSPKVPFYWERLGHNRFFSRLVKTRWQELRLTLLSEESLFTRIDLLVDSTAEARQRNFERWPETAAAHSYEVEIQLLKEWIQNRTQWIESHLDLLADVQQDAAGAIPEKLELAHNYPNPFNERTTITFYLPFPGQVALSVYNISGMGVTSVTLKNLSEGHHSWTWNASGLPSGVYFYQLQLGPLSAGGKMLLLR